MESTQWCSCLPTGIKTPQKVHLKFLCPGMAKYLPSPSHMPQCIKEGFDSWWTCVVILHSIVNEWNVFSGWGDGQEALTVFISQLLNSTFAEVISIYIICLSIHWGICTFNMPETIEIISSTNHFVAQFERALKNIQNKAILSNCVASSSAVNVINTLVSLSGLMGFIRCFLQ